MPKVPLNKKFKGIKCKKTAIANASQTNKIVVKLVFKVRQRRKWNQMECVCGRSLTSVPPQLSWTSVNIVHMRRLQPLPGRSFTVTCQPATRTLSGSTWRTQISGENGDGRQSNEAPQKCQRNCSILINQIVRIKWQLQQRGKRNSIISRLGGHYTWNLFQRVRVSGSCSAAALINAILST